MNAAEPQARRAGAGFYAFLFAITVAGFIVHEAGHWLAGTSLGYDMSYGLNHVGLVRGDYADPGHANLVTAAGPAVTIALAAAAFVVAWFGRNLYAYGVLFSCFMMRLTAAGVSLAHPNDEARISLAFGLGQWTLPAMVVAVLLGAAILASRRLKLHWSVNVLSWVVVSAAVTAVVFGDQALR